MDVIYEDTWVLVIDKPAGQHSQGTAQGDQGSVLERAQSIYGNEVRLVHRLDRDAQGLLVLARNKSVAATLGQAFRNHEIKRTYRAVVSVPLSVGSSGTIDKPLKWAGGRCWIDPTGARAVTHYTVVGRHDSQTEVECTLETGRMHQIRVHLANTLGPIVGDRKYGGQSADQLKLRAIRLEFKHPETGKFMKFKLD